MSRVPPRTLIKAFAFLSLFSTLAFGLPGCSVGDFIGAYFNTYYNARKQFKEAEDELLQQKENRSVEKSFGFTFVLQPATKTKLTSVIEKCSKLLQYHPQSSLVDDALLMIGKSYYYQNQYQQAERKFTELIEQFPNSSLAPESRLLLGYCYYMDNEKSKASLVAKSLLDDSQKDGDDEFTAKAAAFLAQMEVDNLNTEQARTLFQIAGEKGRTSQERCAAFLSLAAIESQGGNYKRALDAYRKAGRESYGYETEYKARIGEARMLSKLGEHEESLSLLRDLLGSSNFREFYPEISLEIGNVFKARKEFDSAIAQYRYVDTTYARTEVAANSYFQLGDLYEANTGQWDSALVYYVKGKTEFPQAPITIQLARRAENLTKYFQHKNAIQRYDSIKTYILTPVDTTRLHASALTDSTGDSLHAKHDSVTVRPPAPSTFTLDSVNTLLAREIVEIGSLMFTTLGLPDSAARWFTMLLAEYPNSPQVPRALYTLAQIYSQDTLHSHSTVDSLYNVIVTRFPESEFTREAKRLLGQPVEEVVAADPAEGSYARAEQLLNAGNDKEANDTLRYIVQTYPASPIASKAQYALGWIYERVSRQPDSAIASYKKLVALYPKSKYANAVRPVLDEYEASKREEKKDTLMAPSDSISTKREMPGIPRKQVDTTSTKQPPLLPLKEKQDQ